MLVLHIIVGLGPGGAEKMLQRLIAVDAHDPGRHHKLVSLTDIGVLGPQLQRAGIEVHALGLRSPLGLPRVFLQLVRLIRRLRPDIVQTWMYHADFLGGLAARLAGKYPVIWGVRTTDAPAGTLSLTAVLRRVLYSPANAPTCRSVLRPWTFSVCTPETRDSRMCWLKPWPWGCLASRPMSEMLPC